jgi:hypothetical protein
MRTAAIAIAAIALAASATAASARISDSEFIQASRCGVLANGGESAEALAALVKAEGRGRNVAVRQMADRAIEKAKRDASSDSATKRASVDAELGGVCQALIGADQTTGQAAKAAKSPAS